MLFGVYELPEIDSQCGIDLLLLKFKYCLLMCRIVSKVTSACISYVVFSVIVLTRFVFQKHWPETQIRRVQFKREHNHSMSFSVSYLHFKEHISVKTKEFKWAHSRFPAVNKVSWSQLNIFSLIKMYHRIMRHVGNIWDALA